MTPTLNEQKNEYAKSICLFLAELLRTRRITLARAADISEKVLANINLVDTEEDFLRLVKELSHDFEELVHFENMIHRSVTQNKRRELEAKIRDLAAEVMPHDMTLAQKILEAAVKDDLEADDMVTKFPQFKQFFKG